MTVAAISGMQSSELMISLVCSSVHSRMAVGK